jgi:ABC-type uncharacterized transport system substrate-binding protein
MGATLAKLSRNAKKCGISCAKCASSFKRSGNRRSGPPPSATDPPPQHPRRALLSLGDRSCSHIPLSICFISSVLPAWLHGLRSLRKGLRELGYIEGQNVVIEYRSADGRAESFPALAADLEPLNVDVIVTRGTPSALAAWNATKTIPIVMASIGNAIGTGLAANLARPGGNVTGLTAINNDTEAKRLELLKEAVPGVVRMAAIYNMGNPTFALRWKQVELAARALDIECQLLDVRKPEDIGRAFTTATDQKVGALLMTIDGVMQPNQRMILELAAKHRLPAIYPTREFVENGGLMAYGASYPDLYRRAATYIDRILKGANPADLPIEQPTKFELVINLKTAFARRSVNRCLHSLGTPCDRARRHRALRSTSRALGVRLPR